MMRCVHCRVTDSDIAIAAARRLTIECRHMNGIYVEYWKWTVDGGGDVIGVAKERQCPCPSAECGRACV